jgi:membrane-bound serine protease (ClpP class)
MVLGSLMLYDAPETGIRISWFVIVPTVGMTAGLVIWAVSAGLRALYRRPTTGLQGMMGAVGVARQALDPEGQVMVDGELWRAVAEDGPIAPGEAVRVRAVDGLTLKVVKVTTGS